MIKMRQCAQCGKAIADKYLCQIDKDDRAFHWNCLRCQSCGTILKTLCHVKNGHILCKNDYLRLCSPGPTYSCQGCFTPIDNNKDWVIKIPSQSNTPSPNSSNSSNATSFVLYHLKCIQCFYCKKNLSPGDKYILNKMNQSLVCMSSPCISYYTSNCSAIPSSYALSMPPSPLQPAPSSTAKMSVPTGRGKRGRGGGVYKKQQ